MVAQNPLFSGRWTLKKFNATVINDIWPEVFFFSLVAAMVSLVSKNTKHDLGVSSALLTVLGTVLGLVISFRTSSAYERYQDGRKMWTNITIASRNIAQFIWIHVPFERKDATSTLQIVIEKKSMINLVQAFSVAVKHYLRGEPGVYYQDLYPLICFLPRYASSSRTEADMLPLWHACEDPEYPHDSTAYQNVRSGAHTTGHKVQQTSSLPTPLHATDIEAKDEDSKSEASWYHSFTSRGRRTPIRRDTFDPEKALPSVSSHRPLKPARNPPETSLYDFFPILRPFKWAVKMLLRRKPTTADKGPGTRNALGRKRKPELVDSNVPLEICLYLSSYSAFLIKNAFVQPAIATGLVNGLSALQDTMENLERIRNTPLPFAYQAHLRMSLWVYLFLLPFQVYSSFGYLTIPATAFASFLLLGFLEIGQEIENPFNYDLNDLDLDAFCLSVQRELHEITAHTYPEPRDFIFSSWNQPFAPADRRTAEHLINQYAHEYRTDGDANGELEPGMMSIRRTLLKSWRDVDQITRDIK